MPDTRWSEMTPDQRDALIHEKVMGRPLTCNEQITLREVGVTKKFYLLDCPKCGHIGSSDELPTTNAHRNNEEAPAYTTDMNAAWLVVEHITRPPTTTDEPWHSAGTRFALWFDKANLWASTGQEAAETICKQALRCVGVTIKE